MLIDHVFMRWRVVVVSAALAGCTKPNPRSCADGTCTDPAFPFCDVGGEVEGAPNTCITVDCTPAEFAGCRGDLAITCNTAGTDFDLIQCERGCEDATGCRLCDPNETACTNGTVATCDADGTVVASQACPLGCFESEPRCRDIDPSNNLGQFLDMVPNPPDLDLANAIFEVDTGMVRLGANIVSVPNFLVPASGNGSSIRVFVVGNLELNSATVTATGDPRNAPSSALAIVARGRISIFGEVLVSSRVGSAVGGCNAGDGIADEDLDGRICSSGGGGGGNATTGAAGGAISGIVTPIPSAMGDSTSGTPALVPLRGGCSGGFSFVNNATYATGGGAVQLSSAIEVVLDGTIDVRGAPGAAEQGQIGSGGGTFQGGGGAGGSVLLEAPRVALGANAKVIGLGGNGARGCQNPSASCTVGGLGATLASVATPGGNIQSPGSNPVFSGGGGGGLGRLRINTTTGAFTIESSAIVDIVVSPGRVDTR